MNNIYDEIKKFMGTDVYIMFKDKALYQVKCHEFLSSIENDSLNEWHLKLNVINLLLCDMNMFEANKKKCEEIANSLNKQELTAYMLVNFANIHRGRFENDLAIDYYKQSLKLYSELNDHAMYSRTQLNYSILLVRMDKYLEAYKILIQLLDNEHIKSDKTLLMGVYSWLAVIESSFNNYEKSIEYNVYMANLALQVKNLSAYSVCQNSLGLTYNYLGKYDIALECFLTAQKIALEYSNFDLMADVLHNIGLVYQKMSDIENAMLFFLQSLEYRKKTSNFNNLAITYSVLGKIYFDKQDWEKAKEYFSQALEIRKKYNLLLHLKESYLDLADYYLASNQLNIAQSLVNNILSDQSNTNPSVIARSYSILEKLNAINGDYSSALRYAKMKNQHWKQYNNHESQQKIIALKNRFDMEIIKHETREKIELEKKKTALALAIKTKNRLTIPVNSIKEKINEFKQELEKHGLNDKYATYISRLSHSLDRIEAIMSTFENNQNISFKEYVQKWEMVEFLK